MTDGYTLSEIATELRRPASWVSERLASLRNELLLQSGLFLPLTETEYEGLRLSIERHGVKSPVIVGEHVAIVDGRHRLLIAETLGLRDLPAVFLQGLGAEAERELAIGLNAARRQLNRAQKRTLIEAELMRDPARSDRLIASICGVTHPTVSIARNEIAEQQELEDSSSDDEPDLLDADQPLHGDREETRDWIGAVAAERTTQNRPSVLAPIRVDAAGAVRRPVTRPKPSGPTVQTERLGYAACSHGQIHTITRQGSEYRLVVEPD